MTLKEEKRFLIEWNLYLLMSKEIKNSRQSIGRLGRGNSALKSRKKKKRKISEEEFWKIMSKRFHK